MGALVNFRQLFVADLAFDIHFAAAGFDEIERLDAKTGSSGGGSGASSITPNYNFDAKSPFLDSVLAAIEAGEWNQVGQLFAQKLNEAMNRLNAASAGSAAATAPSAATDKPVEAEAPAAAPQPPRPPLLASRRGTRPPG